MEDVQNIMNEMENLDKEVVTNNEAKQELLGVFTTENCGDPVPCPNFTRDVTLCCTAVVKHFELANEGVIDPNTVRVIYDPSCLHAIVEKARVSICSGDCGSICVYVVKVVGCIPFAFSATDAIQGPCKAPLARPLRVDLCCQGCVCVDNNICCYSKRKNAEAAREQIANVLNCTSGANGIVIKTGTSPSAAVLTCKQDGTCIGCTSTVNGCEKESYVKFIATLTVPALLCPTFEA